MRCRSRPASLSPRPVRIRLPMVWRRGSPCPKLVEMINREVARVVTVSDAAILEAQRLLLSLTHNLAEPAGAAALAALLAERGRMAGKNAAVILSGGNADAANLEELFRS